MKNWKKDEFSHKRYLYVVIPIVLLGCIVVTYVHSFRTLDSLEKKLLSTLKEQEVLIDYSKSDPYLYALIRKQKGLDYSDYLVVYRNAPELEQIYENDFKKLNPWKIATADIDGNGDIEILIAVKKSTHYDTEQKNRMFIFNFNGEVLYKKWTGSEISGRWRDFYTMDLLPVLGSELFFLEEINEKERVNIYYWFEFGFYLIASSEPYDRIEHIEMNGDNRIQVKYHQGEKIHQTTYQIQNGNFVALN